MLSFLYLLVLTSACVHAQDDDVVGFSVAMESRLESTDEIRVEYDRVLANAGGGFNPDTKTFDIPAGKEGIYYTSLSAGIPEKSEIIKRHSWTWGSFAWVGLAAGNDAETGVAYASRGFMRNCPNDTWSIEILATANSVAVGAIDNVAVTSWTMFRYEGLTRFACAFSVARTTDVDLFQAPMGWDLELVNKNADIVPDPPMANISVGYFEAPVEGYYFFHFSGAPMHARQMHLHLTKEGSPISLGGLISTTVEKPINSVNVLGRSVLTHLVQGDRVYVTNYFGSAAVSGPQFLQTTFSGFGYALAALISDEPVGFYASYGTESEQAWSWNEIASGRLQNWDNANVNFGPSGAAFNPVTGEFIAPSDGTYFISFSVATMEARAQFVVLRKINLNEDIETVGSIYQTTAENKGTEVLSRDVIVSMTAGEKLILFVDGGSGITGSYLYQETSFMAIRLRNLPART